VTVFNKTSNSKVTITELYPTIPWELVANPLVSVEHTLGTTDLVCAGIWENYYCDGGSACRKAFNYTPQHRSTMHLCA